MKKLAVFIFLIFVLAFGARPGSADPGTLYVDAAGVCGGNTPCYLHPQDAVNAANPGDTILVYPGIIIAVILSAHGRQIARAPTNTHLLS